MHKQLPNWSVSGDLVWNPVGPCVVGSAAAGKARADVSGTNEGSENIDRRRSRVFVAPASGYVARLGFCSLNGCVCLSGRLDR
jgi:hypothetical protein